MTETEVATACDALARALGWDVERLEQRRATRIHEGLPDRRYVQRARGHRVWVELKAPKGQLTRDQHRFLTAELATNAHATVIDDPEQLRRLLTLLARDMGRGEALRYCGELVDLTVKRGYRGERKGAACETAR